MKTFTEWLKEQDPDTMPFRDGAPYTGSSFGLRADKDLGPLSPYHPDVDRGASPAVIRMPFDGTWSHKNVGGDLGTLLQLTAKDFPIEVQVGHTQAPFDTDNAKGRAIRGEALPYKPGDEGLAQGVHTHTGVLLSTEYVPELRRLDNKEWYGLFGWTSYGHDRIKEHCDKVGWAINPTLEKLNKQVKEWKISYIYDSWCIRLLPPYRQPAFGHEVILLDSRKWLKI